MRWRRFRTETRTRADYARAMDAYRAIYHAKPGDVHAPAAVNAVAELLAEQGRAGRFEERCEEFEGGGGAV
jgi:hypothetical protein